MTIKRILISSVFILNANQSLGAPRPALEVCTVEAPILSTLLSRVTFGSTPEQFKIEVGSASAERQDITTGRTICSVGWLYDPKIKSTRSTQEKISEEQGVSIFPDPVDANSTSDADRKMAMAADFIVQSINNSHPRARYIVEFTADGNSLVYLMKKNINDN